MQQIHHCPKVAPLLHIYLEEVPKIVKRRTRLPELSLLFDRCGFGIPLCDDDTPKGIAEFSRDLLVCRHPKVVAKSNPRICFGRLQKDSPAVIGHLDIVEMCPAFRLNTYGCSQEYILLLKPVRPHLSPPVQIIWQPVF